MSVNYGIDWADFGDGAYRSPDDGGSMIGGGGEVSRADVENLNKAMIASDGQAVPGGAVPGELKPLMPESLEGTLHSLTYTEADFPFWTALSKDRAYNTAEEYNQLLVAGQGEAGFIAEGDLPEEEDSTYRRNVTLIKFLGVTRRVTHVASLVRTAGIDNAVTQETKMGTLWLMRILEESLFFGDSSMISVEFDGLKKQLIDGQATVYDARGAHLTVKLMNGLVAHVRKRPNYGRVDTLYCSVGTKSDVILDLLQFLRASFGDKVSYGTQVDEVKTNNGVVKLIDDIFIEEGKAPHSSGLGVSTKRPLAPALGGITTPAAVVGTSKFAAADVGTYYYKVVSRNRYGRSAPVTSVAVAVAAGEEVRIPITDGGQGTACYVVYRSEKAGDAGTCKEAFRVARTGATQTITDRNAYLPGTSVAFGLTNKADVFKWKQLAPFTKLPLSTIDTSIRWMMVLYGALQVTKPRHNFVVINLGRHPDNPSLDDALLSAEGF